MTGPAGLALLFAWVMGAFAGLAFLESAVEGGQGGGAGTHGWTKGVLGYRVREYHFWLWYVVVPLFVFSPLVATGFEPRVFGTLAAAYLLGGILEDFLYFAVNPHFGLKKWNSVDAPWMPWFDLGAVEVPKFYVRNLVAGLAVLAFFVWL